VLVTEVATRLGTGADVGAAWDETFARAGIGDGVAASSGPEDGVPGQLLELAARQAEHERLPRVLRRLVRRPPGVGPTTAGALPGTIAACRLTHELGAPLAEVLQRCAEGLTEAGHARAARAVALAGPRATARLLGWLPLLGLLLGAGIGADPVGVLLGGGPGTACLVVGVGLMVLGRRWVGALERAADAAGEIGSATGRRRRRPPPGPRPTAPTGGALR
jgi:tight adherence protein B